MGVNGEAFQLHAVYKNAKFFTTSHVRIHISTASHARIHIRYCKSRENPHQVLQVTCAASERAMKSKVHMIKATCSVPFFINVRIAVRTY